MVFDYVSLTMFLASFAFGLLISTTNNTRNNITRIRTRNYRIRRRRRF